MQDSSTDSLLNTTKAEKSIPLKIAWQVGKNTVVVIDSSLVKRLGITEHETMFSEEIVESGVLLRIVRKDP